MFGLASSLAALIDRFSVFVGYACAVLYLVCIVLSFFEMIMRYGFNAPTQWTFETVTTICATAWVLTSGYVTQQRRHITITTLELVLPHHVWQRMELIAMVLSVVAVAILFWAAWAPAMEALHQIERSGSAFNPPMPTYLKTVLLVGCVVYILQLLANIVHWFEARAQEGIT